MRLRRRGAPHGRWRRERHRALAISRPGLRSRGRADDQADDQRLGCLSFGWLQRNFAKLTRDGGWMLFVDLDDFRSVNDDYGHRIADRLLPLNAQALRRNVGAQGTVVHLSGDDFLVLLPRSTQGAAARIAQRLTGAIRLTSVAVGELSVSRSASIGMAPVTPGMPLHQAIMNAETALLKAKSDGKDRVVTFDAVSQPNPRPSREEIRLALQRKEILFYIQPIFVCKDLRLSGYEALLRWERTNGEVLGPAQFLDTMTRLYDDKTPPPLTAARPVLDWIERQENVFVSFNVSGGFLRYAARRGVDWVQDMLGPVQHERIVVELIETLVDREPDEISCFVSSLRALGVRVALDDFGTGHSTLQRLRSLTVDIVKIDRSFVVAAVASERGREILRGMIALIHATGAKSICEGIETQAQLDMVRALGADMVQGYLLGRPRPVGSGNAP